MPRRRREDTIEDTLVPDARAPRGAPRRTRWPSLLDVGNPHTVVNLGANKALERVGRWMRVDPRLPSALRRASVHLIVLPACAVSGRYRGLEARPRQAVRSHQRGRRIAGRPGGGGTGDDLPRRAKLLRGDRIEEDERAGVRDAAPQRHRRRKRGRPPQHRTARYSTTCGEVRPPPSPGEARRGDRAGRCAARESRPHLLARGRRDRGAARAVPARDGCAASPARSMRRWRRMRRSSRRRGGTTKVWCRRTSQQGRLDKTCPPPMRPQMPVLGNESLLAGGKTPRCS